MSPANYIELILKKEDNIIEKTIINYESDKKTFIFKKNDEIMEYYDVENIIKVWIRKQHRTINDFQQVAIINLHLNNKNYDTYECRKTPHGLKTIDENCLTFINVLKDICYKN